MKKKTVTVLAIEYSKRVCDPQPELIDRMDVRGLVMSAYRSGYNKAHSEHVKRITNIVELKLSDIDSPVFTQEHFDYIMSKIKEQFAENGTGMNIDTEFNVGDSVCYLSGDNIIHTSISKIIIEISYTDDSFLMVYKLSDGLSVPRNNYPQWGKRLFRDKDSLMRYLSES